ncbi:MAG: elongation factor 1-beta [Candidatus Aenigmatarchaeota archaeon]
MGDVAISFKVMPSDPATFESVKAEIEKLKPKQLKELPIGFGLKLLEVLFIVPDKEGNTIEETLKKLPGVASVEADSITLV